MSDSTVSNRVLAAGKEPLRQLGPLQGLFVGFDASHPPTVRQCIDDIVRAIEQDVLQLTDSTGVNRKPLVIAQLNLGLDIAEAAAHDMKNFSCRGTPLSKDQLAVIHLYTQETDAERNTDSAYSLVNAALRSEDRGKAKAVRNFIWTFITGHSMCPMPDHKIVHRGVCEDLSAQYSEGRIIVWYQISSCTNTIEILENPLFLGKSGARTIFQHRTGAGHQGSVHLYLFICAR